MDPDLQIRVGGGGCHPDPEVGEGGSVSKNFFRSFGSPFGLNIGGTPGPPGPGAPPLDPPLDQ